MPALTLTLALLLGCNTKEVAQPIVAGAGGGPGAGGAGGGGGINAGHGDAPASGAADGPLGPSESCLPADALKRAAGQACACASDCATGMCQEGVCCSGAACGAKRPAGSVCDEPGDCESGFCADGVCCNVACTGACVSCNQPDHMGECLPVPAGVEDPHEVCRQDAPETCGQSGTCNGQGGCAKYAAGTVCKLNACEGRDRFIPASTCDGEGTCNHGVAISCAPSTCEDGACITTCRDSGQCMAPATCTAGSCGKRGNGQDCTTADHCGSGFCVQGVCCDNACGGACQTCALPATRGKCSPVPTGASDPKGMCRDLGAASCGDNGRCDGRGACQTYANGTVCQPARCDVSDNAETPAGTCQGGRCNVPAARSCAPHQGCNGSRCATSCGNDGQCTPGNICVAGDCGKRPNGATCNANSQCASGQCAQGRCCASACGGSCKSCAVPGQEGLCANVPARGADPTGTCADGACTNGCNGNGGCLREPVDASCGAASCGAGGSRVLRVCNAAGACVDRTEACPANAPNCTGAGLCRGNQCTASSCPGPCRVCVMDRCLDASPDTSCSGGTCRGGSCVPGTDCQVSAWSAWSACSRACDGGTETRTRTVTQQPTNGGRSCPALTETRSCNTQPCAQPVDCRVSAWSDWSTCSRTCDGGTQTRTRTVTQQPMNGGMACPALSETRACNTDPCAMPVDCQVSAWSDWSTCSKTCGSGTQTRTRTVTRPASNGGMACPALSETRACNTEPCPECVDGAQECVNMDTRRVCNNGRWRVMMCPGRRVCMAGECEQPGPGIPGPL